MNLSSKIILGIFCGCGALWDAITTFSGMYQVVGTGFIALIFTIFVNGAIIISFAPVKNGSIKSILSLIILAAVGCDGYTAYWGNHALVIQGTLGEEAKIGISIGMTVITVGSSFLVSYLIFGED